MDTGIGMEEEKFGILAQKVYKALVYYQLLGVDNDEKISNDSVGIGMGLIVCKAIV